MNLYNYFFYQIYRSIKFTNKDFKFWLDIKTILVIVWIEISSFTLLFYKIDKYFNTCDFLSEKLGYFLFIGLPPLVFNYYIFEYQDKYKRIIKYFEKIDKKEKKKLNIQLLILLLFLTGFIVFLLYI